MKETIADTGSSVSKIAMRCPSNTKEKCGKQDVIVAYPENQKWGHKNMRLSLGGGGTGWKAPQKKSIQTCSWEFMPENARWEKGNISIKFTEIAKGIKVYLWASYNGELIKPILDVGTFWRWFRRYQSDMKYNLTV